MRWFKLFEKKKKTNTFSYEPYLKGDSIFGEKQRFIDLCLTSKEKHTINQIMSEADELSEKAFRQIASDTAEKIKAIYEQVAKRHNLEI